MGLLKRTFGKQVKNETLSFNDAQETVKKLVDLGAKITRFTMKHRVKRVENNPTFEYVQTDISSFLTPYQMEFDSNLKGDTSVKYEVRDYETHQAHKLTYQHFFDNIYKKGIKGPTGILEIKVLSGEN